MEGTKKMAGKAGFTTVETSAEELAEIDAKIKAHRRKFWGKIIGVAVIILVAFAFIQIWFALRTYDKYEVKSTFKEGDNSASHFADFDGNIVQYSNDGIVYMDNSGELIWNQAFEMTSPKLEKCGDYLAVYDAGGKDIYIMQTSGVVKQIETSMLIKTVCVANQGTVAVLMEEDNNFYVKLYDKAGKELASGKFYGNKGAIPVDIALSFNAQKLAVDMIDITGGSVKSNISFYNFGSVGQNEINNNVGTFTYEDTLIPEIEYVSNNCMIAKGDRTIKIFEGSQKPELTREIKFKNDLESVINSNKYIAVLYSNQDEEATHHIQIYDMRGKLVMENDTPVSYTNVEFLSNNELLINNSYNCELYTVHSIKKFSYTFEVPMYGLLYRGGSNDYMLITESTMEEVRLR